MRDVEVAAAEALDGPTAEDLEAHSRARRSRSRRSTSARRSSTTTPPRSSTCWRPSAGPAGRWIHYGLTSSDVVDTGMALQLRAGGALARAGGAGAGRGRWREKAREHADTLCVGRTHGVHAEPTSFGLEARRLRDGGPPQRSSGLERAFAQIGVGDSRGAVGTYAPLGPDYEERVMAKLGLRHEDVSTQVVPRDRHAELLQAIALAGAGLERFATEIRHLQRTEVREVEEPFRAGPEGLVGDAAQAQPDRLPSGSAAWRGCCAATRRSGSRTSRLWHERDISHSGAERIGACRTRRSCARLQRPARSAGRCAG